MLKQTVYDAFTKIPLREKTNIASFIFHNDNKKAFTKEAVKSAIDAVVKDIPSFGGYIISLTDEDTILGVIIVNHTGMEDFGPSHIVSFLTIHKEHKNVGIEHKLLKQALSKTTGTTILKTSFENPQRALFFDMGFKEIGAVMQFAPQKTTRNKKAATSAKVTA